MNADAPRVYFLGAGASKADDFPLTAELKYGVAAAIRDDRERFAALAAHLSYLYNVDDALLDQAASYWMVLGQSPVARTHANWAFPDVTDLLSTLDWMIREQSSFGPGLQSNEFSALSFGSHLVHVRDLAIQALCHSLIQFGRLDSAKTTQRFLGFVQPQDTLITTNWDILLDTARDIKFGTAPFDYGTMGNVVLVNENKPLSDARPIILKLHGSLSWLYCQRCQRLMINPREHIAGDRTDTAKCECTCQFSELIVTPGFVREYRNVHLLTIWREALLRLATATEWVFIGYSLPADDIGIRALLLKARRMYQDRKKDMPRVTLITGTDRRDEVLARYSGILPGASLYDGDFATYVRSTSSLPG